MSLPSAASSTEIRGFLLTGIDHVLALEPEHAVCAHGMPLSGRVEIQHELTLDRDSIQFMWDQTVRGVNKDLRVAELGEFVQLPEIYDEGRLTRQLYGVAEHHVCQIHAGLVGWFDNDESTLFPLPPGDRSRRLVEGFGGAEVVRRAVRGAIDDNELRWAVEMGSWLIRRTDANGEVSATDNDRALLAEAIRTIGQRTTAANIRNWCLTRALEIEGSIDLDRMRTHVFGRAAVLGAEPAITVHAMRVLLDPVAATGMDDELRWRFADGSTAGLRVRNHVAVPTDGADAELELALDIDNLGGSLLGSHDGRFGYRRGSDQCDRGSSPDRWHRRLFRPPGIPGLTMDQPPPDNATRILPPPAHEFTGRHSRHLRQIDPGLAAADPSAARRPEHHRDHAR